MSVLKYEVDGIKGEVDSLKADVEGLKGMMEVNRREIGDLRRETQQGFAELKGMIAMLVGMRPQHWDGVLSVLGCMIYTLGAQVIFVYICFFILSSLYRGDGFCLLGVNVWFLALPTGSYFAYYEHWPKEAFEDGHTGYGY